MARFSFSSLRVRLMLFVLLALLPVLVLVLYTAAEQRNMATANAQEEVLRLLKQTSLDYEQQIEETHQLLTVMAQLPAVRDGDSEACTALFADLLKQHSFYASFNLVKPNGDVFCTVPQTGGSINLTDRSHFQRVLAVHDFAIGDYVISRITGRPVLPIGYPVLNDSGEIQAVLTTAIDLTWLYQLAADASLPQGATLTVIDRHGTILSRYPNSEGFIGKSVPDAPVVHAVLTQQGEGTVESHGIDGMQRLYAFKPLHSVESGDLYIYTGVPTEIVYAGVTRLLVWNLVCLGFVTVLVLVITWLGSKFFFLRHVNVLLAATRRLTLGDLSARTGLPYSSGELGQLARAFDHMAKALEQSTAHLERLSRQNELILSSAGEGIFGLDLQGRATFVNPAAAGMLGYEVEELIDRPSHATCHHTRADGSAYPEKECPICMAYQDGLVHQAGDEVFWRKDGTSFPVEYVSTPIWEKGKLAGSVVVFKDITERVQTESALRKSEEEYRTIFENTGTATIIIEEDTTIALANTEFAKLSGYSIEELQGKKSWAEFSATDDVGRMKEYHHFRRVNPVAAPRNYEYKFINRKGHVKNILMTVAMVSGTKNSVASLLDITEMKRAEERIQSLCASAVKLSQSLDLQVLADDITRICVEMFGVRLAWLGRAEANGRLNIMASFPLDIEYPSKTTVCWDDSPLGQGVAGRAIRSGTPMIVSNLESDQIFEPWRQEALAEGFCTSASFSLTIREKPFGALNLYSDRPGFFNPERVDLFKIYVQQASAALENALLFEEANRRLEHLKALRNIDMAITGSLDLRVTFNVVLDQVIHQLGVHAANILLVNPHMQVLEYTAGRGFRLKEIERSRLRLEDGYAGRVMFERSVMTIPNLPEAGDSFTRAPLLEGEDFISYFGIPLIVKGQVKGLLEIFHREMLEPNKEWLDFLETLAGQAAIAIDNATLFDGMQRSNVELTLAYDDTIEGWSRALDLRDKETEGHSRRVTEMSVQLARALELSEAELVYVRRGALLHDIGKMGVPDHILFKPGPLTEEEWVIMRRHPVHAYEMLSPITYLRPALNIPYCHHEKWDGTGYPRGLKGEQIPLAARIFAVVDVWDALCSQRPYRTAWEEGKVLKYIRDQAGKHFDNQVVEAFLKIRADNTIRGPEKVAVGQEPVNWNK